MTRSQTFENLPRAMVLEQIDQFVERFQVADDTAAVTKRNSLIVSAICSRVRYINCTRCIVFAGWSVEHLKNLQHNCDLHEIVARSQFHPSHNHLSSMENHYSLRIVLQPYGHDLSAQSLRTIHQYLQKRFASFYIIEVFIMVSGYIRILSLCYAHNIPQRIVLLRRAGLVKV